MIKYILCLIGIVIWVYIMNVLKRAELRFFKFLFGGLGLFFFMMILVMPIVTMPLARVVAAVAGVVGNLTGTFYPYFRYGLIFVQGLAGTMTLQIDFECSGIIEIIVFLSLLVFFEVYTIRERIMVGILGVLFLIFANALRVTVICEVIYFLGADYYYIAHSFIGRIIFYALSVAMYFYVFTKPHIIRMKVGKFTYEHN